MSNTSMRDDIVWRLMRWHDRECEITADFPHHHAAKAHRANPPCKITNLSVSRSIGCSASGRGV